VSGRRAVAGGLFLWWGCTGGAWIAAGPAGGLAVAVAPLVLLLALLAVLGQFLRHVRRRARHARRSASAAGDCGLCLGSPWPWPCECLVRCRSPRCERTKPLDEPWDTDEQAIFTTGAIPHSWGRP
jgi:hypothetical protein